MRNFTAQNQTYYPTYKALVQQMVAPYGKHIREQALQIIDPSAGSGDILDFISDAYDYKATRLYAVEQDPELVYTLQGKGYRVLGTDFLNYTGDHLFDLIVMNPPFDRGDAHLLKAWEVLKEGHIVCLLNEETMLNPYTQSRKLLASIIHEHGTIDYLGSCFEKADRPTDVRVALVRLQKKEPDPRFTFDFGQTHETEYDFAEALAGDGVALNDLTGSLLRQYELTKASYIDYIKAKKALSFYSQGIVSKYTEVGKMADGHYSSDLSHAYNGFVDALRADTWSVVINKLGMSKFMTSEVEANFNRYKRTQGAMDLTRENIMDMVQMLIMNRSQIMNQAISDVFDLFTKYTVQNRFHVEGWVTNSGWKVNRKVILPKWVSYGERRTSQDLKTYGDSFGLNSNSQFDDIDKVMCWITGTRYEDCRTLHETLYRHFRAIGTIKTGDVFDDEGESEFFRYKFFRKGTLHLTFKDGRLWEEFNYQACYFKNWLPPQERQRRTRRTATSNESFDKECPDRVVNTSLLLGQDTFTPADLATDAPLSSTMPEPGVGTGQFTLFT